MKKVLLFTLSYLAVSVSVAQSDKQLTHYMFDGMSFNPATTGFKGYCATAIYRGQWDKVENAPNTMLVNAQGSIPEIGVSGAGTGVGLSFMNDVVGHSREMEITLNLAQHFHLQTKGFLSVGLGVGVENMGFNGGWIPPTTLPDPNLPENTSGTALDVNFGLHWKGEAIPYFVGLSVTHLNNPTLKLGPVSDFVKSRNYYVTGGLKIEQKLVQLMPNNLSVTPSFLFKTDGTAGITDFNVLADYWLGGNAGVFGGLTYRTKDAFAIMVGFQQKIFSGTKNNTGLLGGEPDVLKIGYSYDVMTGPLNQYGGGSHELMLNYCMFKPTPPVRRYGNVFILQ